jgi:hypothetical protein
MLGRMLRTLSRAWSVALVASLLGCEHTAELGAYAKPGAATSGSSASDEFDSAEITGETNEAGGSAGEEAEWGQGDGDPEERGDGDGDGDDELCAIDGSESLCEVCVEQLCCQELQNCNEESGCFCMVDCLVDTDPVVCAMTCTPGTAYFQLVLCQAASCTAVCE